MHHRVSARRWRVHSAGNFQLPSRIINNLREVSGETRRSRREEARRNGLVIIWFG